MALPGTGGTSSLSPHAGAADFASAVGLLSKTAAGGDQGNPDDGTADPYNLTDVQLVTLLQDTRGFCDPGRELFEYGWWRNLLYLLSRQWIYWNPTSRQWQDKRLAKWIPKPVTNIIRTTILSVRATCQALDRSVVVQPAGASSENILTAQTVDDIEPLLDQEHDGDTNWPIADFTTGLFGDAFLHPYWDTSDPTNVAVVDLWKCSMCQTVSPDDVIAKANQRCPSCQSPALQKTGQQQTLPIGKGKTMVVSSLELLLPLYAQSWGDVDRLVYLTWRPEHQIRDEYKDVVDEKGKPILDKIAFDQGPSQRSLQLYRAISTTSDLNLTPSVWSASAFTGQVKGTTEQHLWIKPSRTYPKGLYCRFLGESPIPVRMIDGEGQPLGFELPYKRANDGEPIWPWVHYPYEPIYGRLYSQGAVDSIIQKQDQINQLDSMMQMIVQRMGNPIWLEEKGAAVERFTGEPGIIVRWQSVGNGGKPEKIEGSNPPAAMTQLREMYKADSEELAGTYDVLKGQKPTGVESYAGLNLLVERSQSRFTTLFKSRAKAYRDWFEIALELERSYGPTTRVRAVMGPNKSWTFKTFQKADFAGSVTILMDDGSMIPKTALGRRAAIEHGMQMGLFAQKTPDQTYSLFQELGIASLAPSLDAFTKSALEEQQAFEDWVDGNFQGPCPLQVKPWHDHPTHLVQNKIWMNGDFIRDLFKRYPLDPPTPQPQPGQPVPRVPVPPPPPGMGTQLLQLLEAHLNTHAAQMPLPHVQPKVTVSVDPSKGDLANPLVDELIGLPNPGGGAGAPGSPAVPGGPAAPGSGHATTSPSAPGGAGRSMANSNMNAGKTPPPPNPHPAPPVH